MEKDIKTQRIYHALAEYIRRCNEKSAGKESPSGKDGKDRSDKDEKETPSEKRTRVDELSLGAVPSDGEKSFPNVCGFCRFIGKGTRELMDALSGEGDTADRILTVFEDEAFRSGASSAVMTQYLKLLDELRELSRLCKSEQDTHISVFFPHEP